MPGPTIYSAERGDYDKSGDKSSPDAALLETIQKNFKYAVNAWEAIREQMEKDQRASSISGPWSDEDRDQRTQNGRPCIHLDQLKQYEHALVNQVKSEPISVRIDPGGEGTDKETAELRSKRIRAIEYESNAIQAYQTAFEHAVNSSVGCCQIKIEYKSWNSR